ncbi:hypothetical protein EBR21_12845 [bacterium]|nr:hypothetical protein [bacterium]
MDLMKLLKAKTEHLLSKQPSDEFSYCEKILADLQVQFDAFFKDVSRLDEFKSRNPLEGVKAVSGEVPRLVKACSSCQRVLGLIESWRSAMLFATETGLAGAKSFADSGSTSCTVIKK